MFFLHLRGAVYFFKFIFHTLGGVSESMEISILFFFWTLPLNLLLCHTPPHSNPINTSQSWGHSCQGSADIGQGREVHKYWVGEKVLKSLPRILGVRIRGIQVKTFLPPVNSLWRILRVKIRGIPIQTFLPPVYSLWRNLGVKIREIWASV